MSGVDPATGSVDPVAEIPQPVLRGQDKRGNVRPGDDRFLTTAQKRKRDAYVARVEDAKADAEATTEPVEDKLADVLQDVVHRALEQDATPVASPELTDPTTEENA